MTKLLDQGHIEFDESCPPEFIDLVQQTLESSDFIDTSWKGASLVTNDEVLVIQERQASEVQCTFHPQTIVNDYIFPAEAQGLTTFRVPREDAVGEDGKLYADDTYESDSLKDHDNAPDWISEWNDPFYIELEEVL